MDRGTRLGRDVLAGSITIGLVVAATVLASWAFVPETVTDTTTGSTEASAAIDPVAEIAALPDPAALMYASGAVEGRLLFDGIVPHFEWGPQDTSSNDIDVQYRGSGIKLTLVAKGVIIGERRTDRVTAVLTVQGMTFFAHDGECELLVARFEYLEPTDGTSRLVPSFAGMMTCAVSEVRSGDALSYTVAFDR
ncbi:MAG: hypothetical protein HZA58_04040 [Acidimicrobiia bacterium]|nr:hypothetical protein [Acidimicrobiia bacterium]